MNGKKSVVATWLFGADLSNMNAGEGTTNLKELKTYNNGLPYISGQAVRHALRKAIQRENPEKIKCTPEFPCGNITECWLCDIFGYLLPGEGAKRWSPLKASPALGQVRKPITTDLILRLVNDIECPKCEQKINPLFGRGEEGGVRQKEIRQGTELKCPKCGQNFKAPYDVRQAIAYKQLIDNVYKLSISIDVNALGREEVPKIDGEGKNSEMVGIEYKEYYDENKRKERVKSILTGIGNMSDFASQSREVSNASPDAILLSAQGQYNHRLTSAFEMDEEGNVNSEVFKAVIEETLRVPNTQVYFGLLPGIIKNQEDIDRVATELEKAENFHLCDSPAKAIEEVKSFFN